MSPKTLMIFTEEEMGEWVPKLVSVRLAVVNTSPDISRAQEFLVSRW